VNNWIGATLEADGDSERLAASPPVQLARSGQVADSPSPAAAIILPGVSRRTPPPSPCEAGASSSSAAKANISARSKRRIASGPKLWPSSSFDLDQGRRF
jgi:hypothetical protein